MISSSVKFLLNDKILEIKNPDPNQTILNYIRTELKKTGTKEGCSEGGCGACTVVFGELVGNKIKYSSINSCISFVPSLNGKQLLIVEDLVSNDGKLHPVQDAMVKFHGSQCGFCTPGFVMSLFSMFKNNKSYNSELITDSISGNLCRCTGYRPIIDAAKSLNKSNKNDEFSKNKNKIIKLLKKIRPKNIYIKKDNKVYFSPKNINDLKQNSSKVEELIRGVEMSFELDVNTNAEIGVVIDKETGSNLSGRGAGNILMEIDTNGKFNMWGDFITFEGIYNFKNLGVIDKKFTLKPGGSIVWEGNPLEAQMDLEAVYNVPGGANPALLLDNPNFNKNIPTE